MGLTSFFKRKTPGDAPASAARTAPTFDAVERVRTRTRQRLIGAVVLLTIGVIGFPLVFESQPRPIPVDIPIEIPRQDAAPALVLPAPRSGVAPTPEDSSVSRSADATESVARDASGESPPDLKPSPEPSANAAAPAATSTVASGKVEVVPAAKPASAADQPAAARVPVAVATVTPEAASAPAAKVTSTATTAAAGTSDAPAATATADGSARFVVQVGAFADPAAARELRSKMEKLGLKTYTQVAETSAGKRIRVRLGPFATRAEADKAQARSKDAGISAVVLTL